MPNTQTATTPIKEQPLWTVPLVLGILMLSSGGFFALLAYGISTLSALNY